jgi:hypothetical protein
LRQCGAATAALVQAGDVGLPGFADEVSGTGLAPFGRIDILVTAAGFSCGGPERPEIQVAERIGHMGNAFGFGRVRRCRGECSVLAERLRSVARLLDGEEMSEMCREFGISRTTGYRIVKRSRDDGLEALSD